MPSASDGASSKPVRGRTFGASYIVPKPIVMDVPSVYSPPREIRKVMLAAFEVAWTNARMPAIESVPISAAAREGVTK